MLHTGRVSSTLLAPAKRESRSIITKEKLFVESRILEERVQRFPDECDHLISGPPAFVNMPLIRGVPAWVEAAATMVLAVIWFGVYLALKPVTGDEAIVLIFSPILLPLLIVTVRKMGESP